MLSSSWLPGRALARRVEEVFWAMVESDQVFKIGFEKLKNENRLCLVLKQMRRSQRMVYLVLHLASYMQ